MENILNKGMCEEEQAELKEFMKAQQTQLGRENMTDVS